LSYLLKHPERYIAHPKQTFTLATPDASAQPSTNSIPHV
jgi:hypothetical protein